jgi:uncharacterized protein YdeI (YjbR/CyaY-like superfamily)
MSGHLLLTATQTSSVRQVGIPPGHALAKGAAEHVSYKDDGESMQNKRPRIVRVPADIRAALIDAKKKDLFDKFPYSHRKEYITWITSAKKSETQARRIAKMMTMLTKKS